MIRENPVPLLDAMRRGFEFDLGTRQVDLMGQASFGLMDILTSHALNERYPLALVYPGPRILLISAVTSIFRDEPLSETFRLSSEIWMKQPMVPKDLAAEMKLSPTTGILDSAIHQLYERHGADSGCHERISGVPITTFTRLCYEILAAPKKARFGIDFRAANILYALFLSETRKELLVDFLEEPSGFDITVALMKRVGYQPYNRDHRAYRQGDATVEDEFYNVFSLWGTVLKRANNLKMPEAARQAVRFGVPTCLHLRGIAMIVDEQAHLWSGELGCDN